MKTEVIKETVEQIVTTKSNEEFLNELRDDSFDIKIASGGGRMTITMDRYFANNIPASCSLDDCRYNP